MEEKPDVTYSDVGGCKEQIEKLREVVETPMLHVRCVYRTQIRMATLYIRITSYLLLLARKICELGY